MRRKGKLKNGTQGATFARGLESMRRNAVRRPLLHCDRCNVLRRHVLDYVDDDNGWAWAEFWKCLICGHQRLWGISDPLKVDEKTTARLRMAGIPNSEQRFQRSEQNDID